MGFIYCSSCGHQVSDQESKCPNCGANVSLNPNPNPNPNSNPNPNPYPNQMQNNWQQPYQQQPYQQQPYQQQPYPQPNNTNKLLYVIIGLLAALLFGGLAYFLFSQNSEKEEAINELKQQQEMLEQKNEELQNKVDEAKANAQAAEAKKEQAQQATAPNPASGYYFIGSIGSDNGASLTMPSGNSKGSYNFIQYTRDIKFTSYNPNTGALILSAYEQGTGKYIGKFVGTLTRLKYGFKYTGVFTNYKGGKVNFSLEDIND